MSFWKKLFGKKPKTPEPEFPSYPLITAEDNEWGVELIDVREHTLTAVSLTTERKQAENAISFGLTEDGRGFIDQRPKSQNVVKLNLGYPCPAKLPDGPVHLPHVMEEKWALFLHQNQLFAVRSWTREVALVAQANQEGERLHLTSAQGSLLGEPPEDTEHLLDFLIRSHALAEAFPVLGPAELHGQPHQLAQWPLEPLAGASTTLA